LENDEHLVETTSRGRSGIEALESQQFDLLITDIALPDITGDQVLAFAKRTHPNMPVIVITAHPAEVTNRRIHELGADDILLKPFDVTDFTTVVQRHLTFPR
jgi:DNA-binding response OmpR family regulator